MTLAYMTDQQAASVLQGFGLPLSLVEAQGQINDAQALYDHLLSRPWATEVDLGQWATSTLNDTDGSRLSAAIALLTRAGRLVGVPSNWQPFPTASTPVSGP